MRHKSNHNILPWSPWSPFSVSHFWHAQNPVYERFSWIHNLSDLSLTSECLSVKLAKQRECDLLPSSEQEDTAVLAHHLCGPQLRNWGKTCRQKLVVCPSVWPMPRSSRHTIWLFFIYSKAAGYLSVLSAPRFKKSTNVIEGGDYKHSMPPGLNETYWGTNLEL